MQNNQKEQKEQRMECLEKALNDKDLQIAAVPSLELYMDQVICLFQQELGTMAKDRTLTKTMINNYSKEGLLLSIKGKKYSAAHILQMQLICNLKQSLPMAEIKKLLKFAEPDLVEADGKNYRQGEVAKLNGYYLASREQLRHQLAPALEELYEKCGGDCGELTPKEQQVFDVLFLAALSEYTQKAAMVMLAELDK